MDYYTTIINSCQQYLIIAAVIFGIVKLRPYIKKRSAIKANKQRQLQKEQADREADAKRLGSVSKEAWDKMEQQANRFFESLSSGGTVCHVPTSEFTIFSFYRNLFSQSASVANQTLSNQYKWYGAEGGGKRILNFKNSLYAYIHSGGVSMPQSVQDYLFNLLDRYSP